MLSTSLSVNAGVITHYDIDFESPPHGLLPSVGSNPNQISAINSGTPKISPTFGSTISQSLLFDGADFAEGITLNMGKGFNNYRMEFDVYALGLVGSDYAFTLHTDTPNVRNLSLVGGSGIFQYFGSTDGTQNIGGLLNKLAYNVVLDYDLSAQQVSWAISGIGTNLTGSNLFTTTGGDIDSFSFRLAPALGGAGADPTVKVQLDNVRVTSNAVPEPGSLALILLGMGGLLVKRRLFGSSD